MLFNFITTFQNPHRQRHKRYYDKAPDIITSPLKRGAGYRLLISHESLTSHCEPRALQLQSSAHKQSATPAHTHVWKADTGSEISTGRAAAR
jgi:hypothetical protein